MNEVQLAEYRALLGVGPEATAEQVRRAYVNRNFALIRNGSEEERQRLRIVHEALQAHMQAAAERLLPVIPATPVASPAASRPARAKAETAAPTESADGDATAEFPLLAFDNWRVNAIVPPLLFALAWLAVISPVGFLLKGFQVWMHEFGHATAAWLTGRKATPLPFGWTPVEADYSHFVYFGLLLLFGILFVAGLKERKVWPMLIAVGLAGVQYYLTWRMPEHRQEFWWGAFGGVGGEFYLSALMMAVFYVQLPEKFKWGACRYVFFFLGAACFVQTYGFWRDVYYGHADIPYGSMINGEDDANGDMNKLVNDFGWTQSMIRRNFMALGNACVLGLLVVYGAFFLRLNRVADWVVEKFSQARPAGE